MALQGRAYRTYQKVCELRDHPGTPRHERQAAAEAAARMEQRYGFSPIRPPQPPPEPPRSRQNGRADSGHNHQSKQEKPRTGANSRQSEPSGRQTWQAQAERPRSRQEQQRQEAWRDRQRARAQQEEWERFYEDVDRAARDNRKAQEDLDEMHRPRYHFETEAEYQFRIWQEDHPFARGDTMWRKWAELWPPVPPLRGRPSTAKRETTPDSGLDVAAVLVMGAIVAMFLSVVVLAALGGWLGVKQFIFVAVLLAGAGVLLVNMVME